MSLFPALHPLAADVLAAPEFRNRLLHIFFRFGVFGVFFISIVDSSFVPLPLPGVTDIMVLVLAAQGTNPFLLVALATAGSALGGYLSYKVGHAGGMTFLEKNIPPRIFKRVCRWMEDHAILSRRSSRHPAAAYAAQPLCARRRCAGHVRAQIPYHVYH